MTWTAVLRCAECGAEIGRRTGLSAADRTRVHMETPLRATCAAAEHGARAFPCEILVEWKAEIPACS